MTRPCRAKAASSGLYGSRNVWRAVLLLMLRLAASCSAGLDTELEKGIGAVVAAAVEADTGVVPSPALTGLVSVIGDDIAAVSGRQDLTFRFRVLNSYQPNAMALPGGHVYVNIGLLCRASSDHELAGVLAHEVAHIHDRDFQAIFLRQLIFLGLLGMVDDGSSSNALRIGLQVLDALNELRCSREREARADLVGVELSLRAGYDPAGLTGFLAGGPSRGPSSLERLLMTHPPPAERYRQASAAARAQLLKQHDLTMRLASSLAQRGEFNRALDLYALAAEGHPLSPQPLLRRAELLARATRYPEAAAEYRRAALTVHAPDLAARAETLEATTTPEGPPTRPAPREVIGSLERTAASLARVRDGGADTRSRLLDDIRRLARERRVQQALTYSQVLNGEWNSARFITTLLAAQRLLHRCLQWPERALELCGREAETRRALTGLTADARTWNSGADRRACARVVSELEAHAAATQSAASEALRELATESPRVREATIQVSVVLLLLLEANYQRPTNWTRFSVAASQLTGAQQRMAKADAAMAGASAAVTSAALEALRLRMDWEGAQAPPAEDHPYCTTVGSRFGVPAADFRAQWQKSGALGLATQRACRRLLEHEPEQTRDEAEFVLLRLAGESLRTEKVTARWVAARHPGPSSPPPAGGAASPGGQDGADW